MTSIPKLYDYQKKAVADLLNGKRIALMGVGTGKTAVMFKWLQLTCAKHNRKKVLIVTTASKAKSGDMLKEAVMWNGQEWIDSLGELTIISWHMLRKWVATQKSLLLNDWVVAFDEVQKSKGYSSGMGRAFLTITRYCKLWTGYTATPGDSWKDYIAYFTACGLIKNKSQFLREYCFVQTYRGFPEITGYKNEDKLSAMWAMIATAPDTSEMMRELPKETHNVAYFTRPKVYAKVLTDRVRADNGEYIESVPELCHHLRQLCFTQDKQEWLADFIESLGTNAIFFCNYIEEENKVCEIACKVLPKGAKIWRIDGKHHEIPSPNEIGKYDIVVAHYLSGGEALNFQFMHYWVSVSPNYSYSTSEQARGRIRRIGQKMPMFFYYLWTKDSIEDDIYDCLKRKSKFDEKIWAIKQGIDK